MSGIVAESGYIRVSLAELNGRVDRMEVRADRADRRVISPTPRLVRRRRGQSPE
jgi:hypothetical protein